ncbi:MAG: MBL fold metallo-hydrolase, partial [Betaproteobacteria bacterium]
LVNNAGIHLKKPALETSEDEFIAVFNTHVHGDHWLGNHGICEVYPDVPIYAHQNAIERINAGEGDFWIGVFSRMTNGAVDGTKVVAPNIGLKGGETLKLDDLTLRIHHTGHAHSDNDIMIEVVDDKGLFFGDVVTEKQVPNSDVPQDANFKGAIAAIKTMLQGESTLFIPGHGRTGGREVPEAALRFLEELYAAVTKYFKEGLLDYEMKDKILQQMAQYKDWNNFSEMGRVISFVYREVETENF